VQTFDLRSDTVTLPTPSMRAAMAAAEVGDDAYADDPTVAALERRVAALLGTEAALWLPTGTMANQIAVALHTRRGDALACHPGAHVRVHEDASAAALSGVQAMPIGRRRGYTVAELDALADESACGWPPVTLAWLENTIGDAGGVVWPIAGSSDEVDGLELVAAAARARGCKVHLDGARLWNAHVATGVELARYGAIADTTSVALSKGLGAPAGSLLCADADTLVRARRLKHAFGGAMRQAGVLAAAGAHALDHHVARLADDHRRARTLASAIAELPHWEVATPETNIVVARVRAPWRLAEQLCAPLRAAGVLCYPNVAREVRLVVHLGLDDAAIDEVVARIRTVLGGLGDDGA
jgi:threonine aldolase